MPIQIGPMRSTYQRRRKMNRKEETLEQIKTSTTPRGRQVQFCILALLALFCTAMVSAQGQSGRQGTAISSCTIIDKTGFYYLSRNTNATQSSLKSRSGTYPSCILILVTSQPKQSPALGFLGTRSGRPAWPTN
jgi:hypothetical protein